MAENLTQPDVGRRADIIRRRLQGQSLRRIAADIGITFQSVAGHLASEEAREIMAGVRASVIPELVIDMQENAPRIIDELAEIAIGTKEAKNGQVAAATAYLKFAGLEERIVNVVEGGLDITARVGELTPDELDAEIARLERGSDRPPE